MAFCVSHLSILLHKFLWETLTRFCGVQGEASALMSHGKIQPWAWRPRASRSTTHFVQPIPPNFPEGF